MDIEGEVQQLNSHYEGVGVWEGRGYGERGNGVKKENTTGAGIVGEVMSLAFPKRLLSLNSKGIVRVGRTSWRWMRGTIQKRRGSWPGSGFDVTMMG